MYFFTDDLLSLITNETSLLSTQKDPNKPLVIESDDIKKFVGICIIMSFVYLPETTEMMLLAINWFSGQCQQIGLKKSDNSFTLATTRMPCHLAIHSMIGFSNIVL